MALPPGVSRRSLAGADPPDATGTCGAVDATIATRDATITTRDATIATRGKRQFSLRMLQAFATLAQTSARATRVAPQHRLIHASILAKQLVDASKLTFDEDWLLECFAMELRAVRDGEASLTDDERSMLHGSSAGQQVASLCRTWRQAPARRRLPARCAGGSVGSARRQRSPHIGSWRAIIPTCGLVVYELPASESSKSMRRP